LKKSINAALKAASSERSSSETRQRNRKGCAGKQRKRKAAKAGKLSAKAQSAWRINVQAEEGGEENDAGGSAKVAYLASRKPENQSGEEMKSSQYLNTIS
jgi:hypothetical protein